MEHPFSKFVDTLNAMPPAATALAALKRSHALSPLMLLFGIWWAQQAQGGRLSQHHFKQLMIKTHRFHQQVTCALDALSTCARQLPQPAIQHWITEETKHAYHIEQTLICDTLHKTQRPATRPIQQLNAAAHNLITYCRTEKITLDQQDVQAIKTLLQTAFPNARIADIHEYCRVAQRPLQTPNTTHFSQLSLVDIA